jgi:hypothetical protein
VAISIELILIASERAFPLHADLFIVAVSSRDLVFQGRARRDARGIFTSEKDLARKLRRYIKAYSANAKPIQWKYSDPARRIHSTLVSATCH